MQNHEVEDDGGLKWEGLSPKTGVRSPKYKVRCLGAYNLELT